MSVLDKKHQESFNLPKNELLFLPLGGSGEIGMNCNLYHYNGKWLLVDLGVTFNDNNFPNAELILPDIDFIVDRNIDLSGIVLTHAHEDHIGAVPYLYDKLKNTKIYTTSFTASVLKRKFLSLRKSPPNFKLLEYNKNFTVGPFNLEILALTHSIPEPNGVIIKTPKGNIFHTGDWKIDPSPLVGKPINSNTFEKIKKSGVLAMVCDSTNVFNLTPSGSEYEVRENLDKVFLKQKNGKIIITCFASNIARLETIAVVAKKHKRSCVFLGRSLKKIYDSAIENNYLKNVPKFLNEDEGRHLPPENTVLICTGSQGESRAALYKLVYELNTKFKVYKEDIVIFSSREIPGNEKQINKIKANIFRIGCKLIDHSNNKVHVSGHPSKKELKQMYEWIKPNFLIPIHGEYLHLKEHVQFAKISGIRSALLVENGDIIKFVKDNPEKIGFVQVKRKLLIGKRILHTNDKILQNMKKISFNGVLNLVLVINDKDKLISKPIIFSDVIFNDDNLQQKQKFEKKTEELINFSLNETINDVNLEDYLKSKIRNMVLREFGLKPLTDVKVVRL